MNKIIKNVVTWHDMESSHPDPFVSVLGYMSDAGNFPAVREGYSIGLHNGELYFPALGEFHPVSLWAEIPEPNQKSYSNINKTCLKKCKLCGHEFLNLDKSGYCGMCKPWNMSLIQK